MVQGSISANARTRVSVVSLALAAVIGVTVAGCAGGGGEAPNEVERERHADGAEGTRVETAEGGSSAQETELGVGRGNEGEPLPGAAVGNKQRTWPSFGDKYDDSSHATPGQTSAFWWKQRPVWTPNNHDGDFPKQADLKESMKQCDKPDSITLEGKPQQQYVNARYLVVNDEAGPTKSVRGVPRGYAHTPQGGNRLCH